MGIAGHNSGACVVEVSARHGVRLLANDEEERFTGVKHFGGYPAQSIESLKQRLARLGLKPRDLHAVLLSWNYIRLSSPRNQERRRAFPAEFGTGCEKTPSPCLDFVQTAAIRPQGGGTAGKAIRTRASQPLISMGHHENHAAFSYAVSPFNLSDKPVMITVLDGFGDTGAISLYVAERGKLQRLCLKRESVRFAGVFLFDHQLDAGRVDDPLQRGLLHGGSCLGGWRPPHQPLLPVVALDFGLWHRRAGEGQSDVGQLAQRR